jgi:hypothetical protein
MKELKSIACSLVLSLAVWSCGHSAAPTPETALSKAKRMFPYHKVEPLCHAATWDDGYIRQFWDATNFSAEYSTGTYAAILAIANGYDCGVGPISEDEKICRKATFPTLTLGQSSGEARTKISLKNPNLPLKIRRILIRQKDEG